MFLGQIVLFLSRCILISFPPQRIALAQFVRLFSLKLLFSQLLPLAAGCDDKMRLADEKNRDQGLSTRRRNRVLTKIHLIYSVIHARGIKWTFKMEFPPSSQGRSAGGKNICASSYPAPIPRNSAPIAPRFRRLSPKLAPGKRPQIQPTRVTFSRISSLMNHRKHERRGLSIFCRWKRPGWHIFADNEKCFGFFTVGLPPAPHPPPLQAKKANSTFFMKSPSAPRPRLWEFLPGEHLKNMINFKCTIKNDYFMYWSSLPQSTRLSFEIVIIFIKTPLLSLGLITSFLFLVIAREKKNLCNFSTLRKTTTRTTTLSKFIPQWKLT